VFAVVFILIYIPIATAIGNWHRKTQVKIEAEMNLIHNPLMARNFRMLVDILQGNASKEEIEEFRKFLVKIESGKGTYQNNLKSTQTE
jgi:hypothetical protein